MHLGAHDASVLEVDGLRQQQTTSGSPFVSTENKNLRLSLAHSHLNWTGLFGLHLSSLGKSLRFDVRSEMLSQSSVIKAFLHKCCSLDDF